MSIAQLLRGLLHTPLVTVTSVMALAVALGATTLVVSVVDGVLLRELPYRDPDRLVVIWETNPGRGRFENVVAPANFLHWQDQTRHVAGLAAVSLTFRTTLGEPGPPEEVPLQMISGRVFEVLGVDAAVGRTFTPDEDRPGAAPAAVISHRLWQRRFGGDRGLVGRQVRINGDLQTIVGVMPPGFSVLDPTVDLWLPSGFDERARTPRGRYLKVIGRLAPAASLAQAQAEMDQIVAGLTAKFPRFNTGWGARVVPMHGQVTGAIRPALLLLLGAVGLVLLIACVNVANLLLARGVSRRREIAVRASLGASRAQIVGTLLAESGLIALSGAALGYAFALAGLRAVQALAGGANAIPRLESVTLDLRVGAVALAVATVAALVSGVLPALESTRVDLAQSLRDASRGATPGRASRLRRALVVAEVALAVMLLAASGLLIRSLVRLLDVDPGFNAGQVLTARVPLSGDRYDEGVARTQFYEQLGQRLEALPGVTAAGAISFLPITGLGSATSFTVAGRPAPAPGAEPVTDVRIVTGRYFEAMRIPLRRGRLLEPGDTGPRARVLLINETLARQIFPGEDPLGRELVISWSDPGPDRIVGIVGDVRLESMDTPSRPTVYLPHPRSATSLMNFVVRTAGAPETLGPALIREVQRMDASLPVSSIQPMTGVIAESVATRRLVMSLLTAFAGVALVLAGLGIYAVMAYAVAERRAELAIRMALGADRGRVMRLVLGQSAVTTGVGLAIGLVGALATTRLMTGFLFDVPAADPWAMCGAAGLLASVALVASWLPGRAAASVEPLQALRGD
jgi:putative ABC transport system permease protein